MEAAALRDNLPLTNQAMVRVKAYLSSLGLPQDHTETQAKAVLGQYAGQRDVADEDLAALALADVASRFDAWLDHLVESAGETAGCRKDLLAWFLRPVLAEYPDLFLRRGDLPEPVRLALQAAARARGNTGADAGAIVRRGASGLASRFLARTGGPIGDPSVAARGRGSREGEPPCQDLGGEESVWRRLSPWPGRPWRPPPRCLFSCWEPVVEDWSLCSCCCCS